MFNSITGLVTGHQFPLVFLRTGGIEWSLEVSAASFQTLLAHPVGEEATILVYLHVREEILKLYGFVRPAERAAFLELITVSGIGPRQALRILSGTTPDELARALDAEDVPALTRLPGLGTRTAQKMILQLKGHLVLHQDTGQHPGAAHGGGPLDELLLALQEMGFDRTGAQKTLNRLAEELTAQGVHDPHLREQQLFAMAIRELS